MGQTDHIVQGIENAVSELRRDPSQPVTAEIEGLVVEMRYLRRETLGDLFRQVGPWEGESQEELLRRLREARESGGSKEMPRF
jgi:hypothetical protein